DAAARQRVTGLQDRHAEATVAPFGAQRERRLGRDRRRQAPVDAPTARDAAEPSRRVIHEGDEAAAVHDAGPALKLPGRLEMTVGAAHEREGAIECLRDGVQCRPIFDACYTLESSWRQERSEEHTSELQSRVE